MNVITATRIGSGRIPCFLRLVVCPPGIPRFVPPTDTDRVAPAIQTRDPVVDPVILCATQLENVIGAGGIPPCSRAFEPAVTDHFVRALYRAAPDVIASQFSRSIIESATMSCQVRDCVLYQLGGLRRRGLRSLQSRNDATLLIERQSSQSGLNPLQSLIARPTELSRGHCVEVF